MGRKYYVGLDMGTSSVGWAVADEHYRLLRAKGKDLWGVRLFQEADTSADRRVHRVARRRLQREKMRIGYLKDFFADEIAKVDGSFYQRMKDSKFYAEDKEVNQPFALFAESNFTDKDYFQKYPTIFHLRKELIRSDMPHDVRLVYLAILNIFKHRGHFLNAGISEAEAGSLNDIFGEWKQLSKEILAIDVPIENAESIEKIISSRQMSNSAKVDEICSKFGIKKSQNKALAEMFKLMCGLKGRISIAFPNEEYDEDGKKKSISFRDGNFEESHEEIKGILGEESLHIFDLVKQIHDRCLLADILNGKEYLSEARVESYEKHKKDLCVLKKVFREFASAEQYDRMFRTMEDDNYSAYVGSVNAGEIIRRGERHKADGFFANVKKMVSEMPKNDDAEYILLEIEKGMFLPKQLTSANGVIPYQVHLRELKAILQNAENYLPFLRETDDTGLCVLEKIISLFEFRVPYYIGPVFNDGRHNAWAVRKEDGRVLPWNFEEKIDTKASEEEFIKRMIRHCTYLNDEQVLPKNSLLYERFMVLNELNNLKVNGDRISVELKQRLYQDLFSKGKKVNFKQITQYMTANGFVDARDEIDFSGVDGTFVQTLSNYAKFLRIFDTDILSYEQMKIAEGVIYLATIFGESKKRLSERIRESYGEDVLSDAQIKRIVGIKFNDWGRLSKEFLELEGADRQTGEIKTIIRRMWEENFNLMELLSSRFTYADALKDRAYKAEKSLAEFKYEDLEGLYISAPVKRMVWQTILILKELNQILGSAPEKIFVEMARDPDSKNRGRRTVSRKRKFEELYKQCKNEERDWIKEISERDEGQFRGKKLYLYYTQKGRCMYTGEPIELDDLFNNNLYDIDHIYPRHYVKDDSIENNLVLVKKETNAYKSDTFPLDADTGRKMKPMWKSLQKQGFISKEKYERLTRTTEFTDEELASFVNRQIVETRQGTKVVTELLQKTFPDSRIVYSKAGNVSEFRRKFDLIKCRGINDFHHANDAYLNIVVGNVYAVKFTDNPLRFIQNARKDPAKYKYHMDKIFDYTVERNGEVAWDTKDHKSIRIVKRVMGRGTPLVTRMSFEYHGSLSDQNIIGKSAIQKVGGKGYIPIKSQDRRLLDTQKYGGYNKASGSYFFLVEHTSKRKRIRTVEFVPLYLKDKLCTKKELEIYCEEVLGYEEPSVRLKKIKMQSKLKVNGFFLCLTGRSNNRLFVSNEVQLILSAEEGRYIKKISQIDFRTESQESIKDRVSGEKNLEIYRMLMKKHTEEIYSKRPNPVGDKLMEGEGRYCKLPIDEQVLVLLEILKLSSSANTGADLKGIGGSGKTGVMMISKNISGLPECKLIHQSVTGLYQEEVDLLTV